MTDLANDPRGGLPDKRQVAASFSRAAESYDSVAALQRNVGQQLLAQLPAAIRPARWLDLGSGTGYFSRALGERFPASQGVAVDIAEGMLQHARPLGGAKSAPNAAAQWARCWARLSGTDFTSSS